MRYINPRLTLTLPNFISILSPITIQFVVAFYSSFNLYFALYCVILLFGLTATKLNKLYYSSLQEILRRDDIPKTSRCSPGDVVMGRPIDVET